MAGKPFIFMGGKNHKPPMFKEVKDGQIYLYGENASNLFPDYLIDLYTRSPKHRAIIEGKVRFTCGGGWNVNSYSERIDLNAKATYAINNANEEETWNDLTEKLDTDFEIFGGYAVECIWNRTSERIASYHYVPFAKIRLAKTETGDYKWCYLPDWKGITKYEKAKEKEGFKEWNNLGETREKSEIYVRVSSRPTKSAEIAIYPRPSYEAAIPYIEADSQIANYTINNINNNFWGGTIVEMQNVFSTEEEKESFEREWDEQKSGTDNAGKALLIFKNSPDQVVRVERINSSELVNQYIELNKQVQEEIFTAHNITSPMLFGIRTEGQLGGRNEMNDAYELFYSTYIKPKQNILERDMNYLQSFNGFPNGTFNLKAVKPLSMDIPIDKAWEVLNAEEKRQLVAEKTGIDLSNDVETFASQRMKQQDRILAQFEVLGVDADEYEVVKNYHVSIGKDMQPEKSDAQFRSMYFAETVGIEIGDLEANILSAIKNNPKITISEIAQAFDLTPSDANDIISQLENAGLLKGKQGVNWEVSKSGEDTIKEQDVVLDIEVKYRYAVAAGMGANVINSTRDFCRTLIGLNRLYSRDEINRIKNDQDENTNAWVYRGGFYTKKGTNNTTPYCRHIWEAVVVKKRRK